MIGATLLTFSIACYLLWDTVRGDNASKPDEKTADKEPMKRDIIGNSFFDRAFHRLRTDDVKVNFSSASAVGTQGMDVQNL